MDELRVVWQNVSESNSVDFKREYQLRAWEKTMAMSQALGDLVQRSFGKFVV